jgi:hypothetical protein
MSTVRERAFSRKIKCKDRVGFILKITAGSKHGSAHLGFPLFLDRSSPHGPVAGNGEGSKVTEAISTGIREFIMLADSGEIISQSPKPQSVSGAGLNT